MPYAGSGGELHGAGVTVLRDGNWKSVFVKVDRPTRRARSRPIAKRNRGVCRVERADADAPDPIDCIEKRTQLRLRLNLNCGAWERRQ